MDRRTQWARARSVLVRRWARGKRHVSLDDIYVLVDVLEINVVELLPSRD